MKMMVHTNIEDRLEKIEIELGNVKKLIESLLIQKNNYSNSDTEKFMNVAEVAKFLKVSSTRIYEACSKSEIKFSKIGKLYKFRKEDVINWVEKNNVNQKADIDNYVNNYLQNHILKS